MALSVQLAAGLLLKLLSTMTPRTVPILHRFMVLLELLMVLFAHQNEGQSPSANDASSLNTLLQDYAFRALVHPHTGVIYDGTVPSDLTDIRIAAIRLRSGSLRRREMRYNEFSIPLGLIVKPYVVRLVLVYHNLGNWSSLYYPLPGYTFLTPVIGLLAYDATNLSATSLPELQVVVSESPISINFSNVTTVPNGARCVRFGLNSSLEFENLVSSNSCSTDRLGHFSIVVTSSERGSHSKVWKIVGGVVGGLIALLLFALIVFCLTRVRQNKKVAQMEQHADAGVSLQTSRIGNTQVAVASVTRTQPVLENELVM
ncbi:hypothetical protein ZIOFF_027827 [Zingiber officinale]|uniref:Transmembrane protein n=2 Tax=Zingiber officinale TaxID=94328 RepID=A0A8J5H4Z7_ZINOF|nr:hypothetical protein ZIOFF_027827 [Zingiber officinale]